MLRKHDRIDLALRGGIVLQHGGHLGVRLDDFGIAERDFFRRLRIFGSLLRHASAAGQGLPPRIDALFLLVGDFGALALRLGLGKVRGGLALRGFALLDLGALRIVVEFRQQRAGLHEIALVRLDGDHLSGDLESNFGNDLRFDRADAEHANFNILLGRRRADTESRAQSANSKHRRLQEREPLAR